MFAKVAIFFAALAAVHANLVGPYGYGAPLGLYGKGLVAVPNTISSQKAVISHVAPVAAVGHGLIGGYGLGLAGHGLGLAGHGIGLAGPGLLGVGPYGLGKLGLGAPYGLGLGLGKVGIAGPIYGGLGKVIY